jgi:RNA polymerase sigma-70 factor (ECF subfamily)
VNANEKKLIDECLKGKVDAFGELIHPYQDRLYNTLFRMVGQRHDADELFQETMICAFRGLATYHGEASFYTWLYRIAMNVAMDRHRKQQLRVVSIDVLHETGAFDVADEHSAQQTTSSLEQQETHTLIQKALEQLGDEYRAIIILKDVEGFKYEEIAAMLDVPIGTVRSRLHRARAELRAILEPMRQSGIL